MGNLLDLEQYWASEDKPWKAHCAIDVGSVTCGYAYSFEDTDQVWINDNWTEHLNYLSYRAPSALLYDQSGKAVSFGTEACECYISLTKEEKDNFQFFYDGLLDSSNSAEDTKGNTDSGFVDETPEANNKATTSKRLQPVQLKHRVDLAVSLSQHCKQEIVTKYRMKDSQQYRTPDEIVWTVVVPYTWDIEEKRTFREMVIHDFQSAYQDDFSGNKCKLQIVTSTEALWAALQGRELLDLERKEKAVMLVHAGGERTEISIHTKRNGHIPIGTDLLDIGGAYINNIFESHLSKCLGSQGSLFVTEFKAQYEAKWLQFLLQFEALKPAFCYYNRDLSLDIDYAFAEAFAKVIGKPLKTVFEEISRSTDRNQLALSNMGKLVLTNDFVKWLNLHLCYLIGEKIKHVLLELKNVKVEAIILTGGLGTSAFLKEYLYSEQEKKKLDTMRVYRFESAATLVAEGAALRSKERNQLTKHYALVYVSTSFESSEKGFSKVYPIMVKGQEIEVGRCFQFGPIEMDTHIDKSIYFDICEVRRDLAVLPDGKFHLVSSFTDKTKIDKVNLDIPPEEHKKTHRVFIDVIMDVKEFKLTMKLKSCTPQRRVSVLCPY